MAIATVDDCLDALPDDRRAALTAVREAIEGLPLDLVAEAVARFGVEEYVAAHERSRGLN